MGGKIKERGALPKIQNFQSATLQSAAVLVHPCAVLMKEEMLGRTQANSLAAASGSGLPGPAAHAMWTPDGPRPRARSGSASFS